MSTAPHVTKVVPVGYADVSQFFKLDGDLEPMAITYGVQAATPPLTIDDVLGMRLAYISSIAAFMPPFYKVSNTRATVPQSVGDPVILEIVGDAPGTDTPVGHLTQNTALLVTKGTASGGRRNRGRFYVPGLLNEGIVNNVGDVAASTFQPLFDDFLDSLTDVPSTGVSNMVLFHSYEWIGGVDPGPPPGFPDPTPVTALVVNGRVATQRRRLRR